MVAAALVLAAPAAARDPRLEQLAPTPADTALAEHAVLNAADVGAGWTSAPSDPNRVATPDCPYRVYDFSAFTITGQAQAAFRGPRGSLVSRVEVYATRAQARGDYRETTRASTAACHGYRARRQLAQSLPSYRVKLLSAKTLAPPRVGEQAAAYRTVVRVTGATGSTVLVVDLIGFRRGRTLASVVGIGPRTPLRGTAALARTIDARLRSPVA